VGDRLNRSAGLGDERAGRAGRNKVSALSRRGPTELGRIATCTTGEERRTVCAGRPESGNNLCNLIAPLKPMLSNN
jgi:hypothetical protein